MQMGMVNPNGYFSLNGIVWDKMGHYTELQKSLYG